MSPLISLVLLVVLFALPLAGRSRGLHAVLALAALAWVIGAAVGLIGTDRLVSIIASLMDPALHDTYYVVSHIQYQLAIAALMAGLALTAWLARPLSWLATLSFWAAHIGLIASVFGQEAALPLITAPSDGDYLKQAERLEMLNTFTTAAAGVALIGLATLILLILAGVTRRIRARD